MTDQPPELFQRWYHSFEEDTDEEEMWRPADYSFPPSRRPRPSIEFQSDGTLVEYRPGPADQEEPVAGRWEPRDVDRIVVHVGGATRGLEIISHDWQLLRIRK
jgi:hypothetical protein